MAITQHGVSQKDIGTSYHVATGTTPQTINVVTGRDCVLWNFNINTKGTTGSTLTIQDGNSNVLAVYDSTINVQSFFFGNNGTICYNGLTIIIGTANSGDYTLTYS